jgi:hypothetical protein
MSRTRWFDVAAVVLTIAMLAGMGYGLRARTTPTIAVAPSAAHVDRPPETAKAPPSVLFVSDSYTAGMGLKEMYYGCTAAVQLGWLCDLSAQVGTGYISGGPANRFALDQNVGTSMSFDERLPRLSRMYDPQIVVLDGGRNDVFAPADAVFTVMSATIADVRRTWPAARIVVIRPRSLAHPDDDLGFDDGFIDRLRAEPAADGMLVIDPISQFSGTDTSGMVSPDGSQPDRQGVSALSSALVDALLDNGFTKQAS